MIEKRKRIKFFNCWIDPLTMEETLKCIEAIIQDRIPSQHVVINVAKLVNMQNDENLKSIVNSCGLINADGQGIVWAAKFLNLNIPERVTGIDLMLNLVKLASEKEYKVYLLGAREEILKKVVAVFKEEYPNLNIVGYKDGYFLQLEEKRIVSDIKASEADILFVAMSSPQKELFLSKHQYAMGVPFVMGVGGSFDVVAGHVKRAPLWMQKIGLEWFFRFLCEPRRMWKRYLVTNTIFLFMLLKAVAYRKVTKE